MSILRSDNSHEILKEYCDDFISHNGKIYYEQEKTAKHILQISSSTFESKLRYVSSDHRVIKDNKVYVYNETILKNLRETNQLFVIPLLEKLNFVKRLTINDTRKLKEIPFSRIVTHDMMKTVHENGRETKGLRDELLFLDSIVYTLKFLDLDWPGNLEFQCTKVVDGYRYDLFIKCSKICIEYNEYKSHHTSEIGISHDDEKKKITDSEGYLLLHFDQTKKGDNSKQSTLNFISELIPLVKKRRHLHDNDTSDEELYLNYLVDNGIDKDIAKVIHEISLYKESFKLSIKDALKLMRINLNDIQLVNETIEIVKELDYSLWKCEIDDELNNNSEEANVDNIRLNHMGFIKTAICTKTQFSLEILDYYLKIDSLCNKMFTEMRNEQKEFLKRIEKNKDSYKNKLESQKELERSVIESVKKQKDIEIEHKDALIEFKNNELSFYKPLHTFLKNIDDKNIEKLPSKFKILINKFREKMLIKAKNYDEISDGDILFEEMPYLVYSKYGDDCISFKEIKDRWNSDILNIKKKLRTYKELVNKFLPLQRYQNIKIQIEQFETNTAHNIDNNQITHVKWKDFPNYYTDDDNNSDDENSDDENSDDELDIDFDEMKIESDSE